MTNPLTADELIDHLALQPHPEGGYFRETYKSAVTIPGSVLPSGSSGDRAAATAIYFLLRQGEKSRLHRLRFDEVWHFYLGGPLRLVVISPEGKVDQFDLGQDLSVGQELQQVAPAGHWFGAYPLPGAPYSLVGCTVAPGFAFEDFGLGDRDELISCFPHLKNLIADFTQD